MHRLHIGEWIVNSHANTLLSGDVEKRIDRKAMQVLMCLAEKPGETLTRPQLLDLVWRDTAVSEEVLTVAISTLRKGFQDQAQRPRYIQTEPRVGYRLIAPVRPVSDASASPSAPVPPTRIETGRVDVRPSHGGRKAVRVMAWLVAVAILALVIWKLRSQSQSAQGFQVDSVAVLPLANYSADPASDYIADGMTEALITSLAKLNAFRVVSRTSVMAFKDPNMPLVEIAELLGVDAIVEGSVQCEGDQMRVTAQLIAARDDTHLWTGTYDHPLTDVLRLQSDIALDIARQVQGNLGGELATMRKMDPEAYRAFLRGRFFRHRRGIADLEKAIVELERAVEISPEFAEAHAALAECHFIMVEIGAVSSQEGFAKGKPHVAAALKFAPTLAEAHAVDAILKFGSAWDFAGAEASFRRAIAGNSQDVELRMWYTRLLTVLGRFDEALTQIDEVRGIDPSALSRLTRVNVLYRADRGEEALAELAEVETLQGETTNIAMTYAMIYESMNRYDEAFDATVRFMKLAQFPAESIEAFQVAYSSDGVEGAYRFLDNLAVPGNGQFLDKAKYRIRMGDRQAAIDYLERGLAARDMYVLWAGVEPSFRPLRGDKQFVSYLHEMGLPTP